MCSHSFNPICLSLETKLECSSFRVRLIITNFQNEYHKGRTTQEHSYIARHLRCPNFVVLPSYLQGYNRRIAKNMLPLLNTFSPHVQIFKRKASFLKFVPQYLLADARAYPASIKNPHEP